MITYDTLVYDNNSLEEVPLYKYLGIHIHHNLNWNYSVEKNINGGQKTYYGLENKCKWSNLRLWDKKNPLLILLSLLLSYTDVKSMDAIYIEILGEG